jgi:hypothetical protein
MKKRKPNLSAKVQALNNELKSKGIVVEKTEKNSENNDLTKMINQDLIKTLILITASFGILIAIKYLNTNFSLNKFF